MKSLYMFSPPWNQLRLFKLRHKLRGSVEISKEEDEGRWITCTNCIDLSLKDILFMILILAIGIVNSMSVNLPSAVEEEIIEQYHVTLIQFSYLYTLTSLFSILFNGFAGFLIDRLWGVKLSTVIYSIVGLLGGVIFCLGGVMHFFWLMLTGRLIFWLGKELVTWVCMNYCLFHWYRNKIMNLIGCLFTDGAVIGSILVYRFCPKLLNHFNRFFSHKQSLDIVISLGSGIFVITAGLAILITYLRVEDKEEDEGKRTGLPTQICNKNKQRKVARIGDLLSLPLVFWLLCLVNALHCSLTTFSHFSLKLLTSERFSLSGEQAKNGMLAMSVVKIGLSLPLSISVDLLGRNSWYIILAQALSTLSFFFLSVKADPFAGMILVGLSSAIYDSAILPMFAYPVEPHLVGTCYGIVSVFGGVGSLIAFFILRLIIDRNNYSGVICFYLITSILSLIFMVVLWILDKRCAGVLSMTPKQRRNFEYRMDKGVIIKSMGTSMSLTAANSSFNSLDPRYSLPRNIFAKKTAVLNTTQNPTQNRISNT